jgi:glycerol uptake facilitator-like aquaporin
MRLATIRRIRRTAMFAKLSAEALGTFWLVLGGCGSAVLAAAFPELGIGLAGVSLAFGLTVLTGAYALGPISGGHFNPAVSVGLWAGGRFPGAQVLPYVIAQVIGAIVGAAVLYVIASGKAGFTVADGFASNGYAQHSPGGYSLADPLDQHPGYQHLGESRTQHRPGVVRRRLGLAATVAVLGAADRGRSSCGLRL